MSEKCKEQIRGRDSVWPRYHQCTRKAWNDGYCKQHHPETIEARKAAADAEWKNRIAVEAERRRLERAAPDMLEALQALLNYAENTESELGITLDSAEKARAAIKKATS